MVLSYKERLAALLDEHTLNDLVSTLGEICIDRARQHEKSDPRLASAWRHDAVIVFSVGDAIGHEA